MRRDSKAERRRRAMFAEMARRRRQSRARSEAVRNPFNLATGKFEPKSKPSKEYSWKHREKFGKRAERYFTWRGRKTLREESERGKGNVVIGRRSGPPPKKFTKAEVLQLERQYLASLKKLGRQEAFTPEEMRKRKQEGTKTTKPKQERLPPGHLFFPPSAEETAAAVRYGISPPVKMWDTAIKGGNYEPYLDPERMVYPGPLGLRKLSRTHFQREPATYAYKRPPPLVSKEPVRHDPETIRNLSGTGLRKMLGHRLIPMSEVNKPPDWDRPADVKPYEAKAEVRRKTPAMLRERRKVIENLPLHQRSQAEWDAAIAARREMGAFAVDQFGNRVKRGVTKQYPPETTLEMLWREGRARGQNETDAAYKARRARLFSQLFPEPEKQIVQGSKWDRDMGVTNENLQRYLTDSSQFDPIERVRIRNALRRHNERRNMNKITYRFGQGPRKQPTPPRTYREVLANLKAVKEESRKARQKAEQFHLKIRAEQAQKVFEKREKWKARRKQWRKSLSKLTSRIFGK